MGKYVCVTKCFYRGRLWVPGESLAPETPTEKVPHHFKLKGEVKPKVEPQAPKAEPKTLHEMQADSDKAETAAVAAHEKALAKVKAAKPASKSDDDFLE